MGTLAHQPSGDWRNDGWSLVGSAVNALWQALSVVDDTKYIKCPASKGGGTVTFPVDITSVPDGAVIVSVTVNLRCSTGSGSAPTNTAPSVTVAVSALDDTSRFTTRTIYPTSTIATYEVATYRLDALGLVWDIFRLNNIMCRIFCYAAIFDLIRCYQLFCTINYRVRPTITVDAPTGTVTTSSPTVSWTYTQSDGDPQVSSEYKVFTSTAQSAITFNPNVTPPVFSGNTTGDVSSVVLPTSLNPDSYWVYVRSYSSYGAKSVWVGRQFTVAGTSPGTPGLTDPNVPGSSVIQTVPDRAQGLAQITIRDTSNMLSAQVSDPQSSADGAALGSSNCTITRDTTNSFPGGTASWKLSSTASGTMSLLSDWIEVDAQPSQMTARAQFLTAASARSCRARILFYDSNFAAMSGTLTGSNVTDATGTWNEASVTGMSPGGAAYAVAVFDVLSTGGAAEIHYVDRLALLYGNATPYSDGGHMSKNLLSSWYSIAEGSAGSGESWVASTASSTSVVSATGTGASGVLCNKMTYAGLSPTIALRAAGTAFNSATSGNDYTLNKPAGVASGDLMLAYVTVNSVAPTINPPAGWVLVDSCRANAGGAANTSLFVLKRTAGGSEPSTWTDGTISAAVTRRCAIVVAYSGAADAVSQPLRSTTAGTGNATPMYLTTPTLNNTDPNAWRISAFAVSDDNSGGTLSANRQTPSTVPDIQYVGAATAYLTQSTSSYIINKPAGTVQGDLMIGLLSISGDATTVTPPTGWTLQSRQVANSGSSSNGYTLAVVTRFAGASEPSSWTGSFSGYIGTAVILTGAAAYRNVNATTPFISQGGSQVRSTAQITTATITNTNSKAWRICAFGMRNDSDNDSWTSNEVIERGDGYGGVAAGWFSSADVVSGAAYDSNGPVSTGSYNKIGFSNHSFFGAASWIAMLNPLASPPSPLADETARGVATVGSSTPWLTARVFDSNGVVPTGNQSITGVWTPGSGSDMGAMAGWQGLIIPASPQTAGYVVATTATPVDISMVDPSVLALAGGKVSVTASFLGSVAATPYLTVNFYRANQLLASTISQGSSFGTSLWVKSSAVFDMPDGTTRMTVTVSAQTLSVSDYVLFDRVSLVLGSDTAFRPGTSRPVHPVWSKPVLEYADDSGTGYGPYISLHGTGTIAAGFESGTGLFTMPDHTVVPLTNRKYRAQTVSYGLAGDSFASGFGPDSDEFRFEAENWWLKDVLNPDNNVKLYVKAQNVKVNTSNTATVFQPLGEDLPVVLTEGYKGDVFQLVLTPVRQNDWAQLKVMLASGSTLFLQSDADDAWWVRPMGDLQGDLLPTGQRQSNPIREVTVTFVEVAPID